MIADNILQNVSYHLVETYVNTTLEAPVAPGFQTATPGSMNGIYAGAQLIVGSGPTQEIVTVFIINATTFEAAFVNSHDPGEAVFGATFPSGQLSDTAPFPLFTQVEMLGYLADVQNEFLLKVRPIYFVNQQPITTGTRFYTQPADCIRIEHISVESVALRNTTQDDLDLDNPGWPSQSGPVAYWFQDAINNQMYGFKFTPAVNDAAELWYSQRAAQTLALTDTLLVPDVFAGALKFGVLARCFAKDGEQRDPYRADFCDKMFKFWLALAIKFMKGVDANMAGAGDQQGIPSAQDFSPFQTPQVPDAQAQQAAPAAAAQPQMPPGMPPPGY